MLMAILLPVTLFLLLLVYFYDELDGQSQSQQGARHGATLVSIRQELPACYGNTGTPNTAFSSDTGQFHGARTCINTGVTNPPNTHSNPDTRTDVDVPSSVEHPSAKRQPEPKPPGETAQQTGGEPPGTNHSDDPSSVNGQGVDQQKDIDLSPAQPNEMEPSVPYRENLI
ncbi:hypothetical protein SNE40_001457 [Patella caerulea]